MTIRKLTAATAAAGVLAFAVPVNVRLPPDELTALDAYRDNETRPEAMRRALRSAVALAPEKA